MTAMSSANGHDAEPEVRDVLAALAEADAAVRQHQDPRSGPEFEAKYREWQRVYRRAIAVGSRIEGESA